MSPAYVKQWFPLHQERKEKGQYIKDDILGFNIISGNIAALFAIFGT